MFNIKEATPDELEFRDKWVSAVCGYLDVNNETDKERITEMFNNTFNNNIIKLYNTVYNKGYQTTASQFFLKVKDKNIINENGVLTFKHEVKTSPVMTTIDGGIKQRQVKKKQKQSEIKIGKMMEALNSGNFEYALKVLINGCYGLHLYPGSPFFNVTLGSTCTAAARNMVAVAAIVIELLEGGFRNYKVEAHIKTIEVVKGMSEELDKKYNFPDVDVETVLKNMLGDHYEGYYAKTFLRHKLENVPKHTLKLLNIKNNIYNFLSLPQVDSVFRRILKVQYDNPDIYLQNPKRDELYKDLMKELYDLSSDILYGFYYYDGDYYNGNYYETLVDIIENIKRKKIVLMDTDSAVTSFQREVRYCMDKFKGLYRADDFNIVKGVIPSIVCWIYMGCIDKALLDYVMELGVSEDYAKLVEMEMEHMMEQLQLSLAKKSYAFIPVITDFFLNKTLKLKLKGVSLIKSNFNQEFCQLGIDILKKDIMIPIEKLSYSKIINNIKDATDKAINILKSKEFILEKRTLLKINSTTLLYSEHKMKSVNLWNMLYPEDKIDYPGSFGVILLSLNEDKLTNIKVNLTREYEVLVKYTENLLKYKNMMTIFKKFEDTINFPNDKIRLIANNIVKEMTGKEHEFNPDLYDRCHNLYNLLSSEEKKDFRELFKVTLDVVVTDDDIIKNVKKIATPLDLNTVPQFLSHNNYDILDLMASSEVEHTLSPLTSTIGLIFSKNKDKRNTITSIINAF